MSSSENQTSDPSAKNTDWTEKQLPPVKPPTTGFLMQLFFVPMLIVSIIVGVWIMFGWLAQAGTNPKQLAENLRQLNKGSWQDAHGLANLLADPTEKALRKDTELATDLANILTSLLEDPNLSVSPERHRLAHYLCQALGEFEVKTGLEALTACVQVDDFKLRRSALVGITKLAANLQSELDDDSKAQLVEILRGPAMERSPSPEREDELKHGELRSRIAFALGVIGGKDAPDVLNLMLGDPYPEARYNAATGLARAGDLRAIERLKEMLQLENTEATKYEVEKADLLHRWKQNVVIVNGLRGVKNLYTANADAPLDKELVNAVKTVSEAGVFQSNDEYRYELDGVLRFLDKR